MGANSSQAAEALFRCSTEPAIAALMLEHANSPAVDHLPDCGITDAAASRWKRGKVAKAQIIAAMTKDPRVLATYAKDSRVSVRRLVAANPATPEDTRKYLLEWADKHNELEVKVALALFMPAEVLDSSPGITNDLARSLARGIRQSGDPELVRRGWSYSTKLRQELVPFIYEEKPGGFTLEEAVHEVPSRELPTLLGFITRNVVTVTPELVRVFALLDDAQQDGFSALYTNKVAFTSEAIALVKELRPLSLIRLLAKCASDDGTLRFLLTVEDSTVSDNLVERGEELPTWAALELGPVLAKTGPFEERVARKYLRIPGVATRENLLTILRVYGSSVTDDWVLGKLCGDPDPVVLATLAREPGNAFRYKLPPNLSYRVSGRELVNGFDESSEPWLSLADHQVRELTKSAWADLAIACMGPNTLRLLTGYPSVHRQTELSSYIYQRMYRTFGNNTAAWDTCVSLIDEWEGGLDDLLLAVCTTTGLPTPVDPVDAVLSAATTPAEEQPSEPTASGDAQLLLFSTGC